MITEATPVIIWLSGTDTLCYYFNKSRLDFVERTIQQEMGSGWKENVHPDDFDRCLQNYMTYFDARQRLKWNTACHWAAPLFRMG
jgi:PAS domain-containing protein